MTVLEKILHKFFKTGSKNEQGRLEWLENSLLKIPKGSKILDAGAGELDQKRFCGHLEYVSQDFGQYDGSGDSKGLQTTSWDNSKLDIVSDITDIPVQDNSFDAIMCVEVFEHIPDPISAIKEFARILKPEGTLIITAPFCSLTHFSPYHFSTGFNKYFYEKHLNDNGFEIVEIAYNGNYFEYIAQELRRIKFCAKTYSNKGMNFVDWLTIFWLSYRLGRFSKNDKGSKELLCFGLHIVAKKI